MAYVCQPVGSNGQTNGLASNSWREDLRRHDPIHASNAEGEIGNICPNEHCRRPACCPMLQPAVLVDSVQGTNNQLRDAHAYTTNHQDFSTTPSIHEHDGWNSGKKVDYPNHACSQEIDGVSGQSNLSEYLWGVVNDRIYSCELLDDLEKTCDQESAVEVADSEELEIQMHIFHDGRFDMIEASIA